MGYYLRKYVDVRNKRKFALLFVAALALPVAMYLLVKVNHYIITDRMSLHVLCLTVCYFSFIKQLKMSKRLSLLFYDFAQHSFGIYLVHIILMKYLVKPIVVQWAVSNWIQIPVVIFSTVVVSYIVVHLLSKLPYSKYVVGLCNLMDNGGSHEQKSRHLFQVTASFLVFREDFELVALLPEPFYRPWERSL